MPRSQGSGKVTRTPEEPPRTGEGAPRASVRVPPEWSPSSWAEPSSIQVGAPWTEASGGVAAQEQIRSLGAKWRGGSCAGWRPPSPCPRAPTQAPPIPPLTPLPAVLLLLATPPPQPPPRLFGKENQQCHTCCVRQIPGDREEGELYPFIFFGGGKYWPAYPLQALSETPPPFSRGPQSKEGLLAPWLPPPSPLQRHLLPISWAGMQDKSILGWE